MADSEPFQLQYVGSIWYPLIKLQTNVDRFSYTGTHIDG